MSDIVSPCTSLLIPFTRSLSEKPTIARVTLALDGKAVERKDRRRSHCATSRTFCEDQRSQPDASENRSRSVSPTGS